MMAEQPAPDPTAPILAPTATPLDQLRAAAWNPRTIKDVRFQALCRSIAADPEFLWQRPVLAMADGTIYAGAQRFRAVQVLHRRGDWPEPTIPAICEDVDEATAKARAVRDNGAFGEWEATAERTLLGGLTGAGFDASGLGFDPDELATLQGTPPAATAGTGEAADDGVRKVELIYGADQYSRVVDGLAYLRQHYAVPDNATAIATLLHETRATAEAADAAQ